MKFCPHELSHVGSDNAKYIQEPGFEQRTPHFFTFKMCELQSLDYLTKKKSYHDSLTIIKNGK